MITRISSSNYPGLSKGLYIIRQVLGGGDSPIEALWALTLLPCPVTACTNPIGSTIHVWTPIKTSKRYYSVGQSRIRCLRKAIGTRSNPGQPWGILIIMHACTCMAIDPGVAEVGTNILYILAPFDMWRGRRS